MAERFLFISSFGFVLAAIGLIEPWLNKAKRLEGKLTLGLASAAILALSWATISRNPAWESDEKLFTTDLRMRPNSVRAHHHLADIYQMKGDTASNQNEKIGFYRKAIELIEKGIAIYPTQELYKQLGSLYSTVGEWQSAIKAYSTFTQYEAKDVGAWMQLGIAFHAVQNLDQALSSFQKARALDPGNASICNNLGTTYAMLGRKDEAARLFTESIRLDPNNTEAKENLRQLQSQ